MCFLLTCRLSLDKWNELAKNKSGNETSSLVTFSLFYLVDMPESDAKMLLVHLSFYPLNLNYWIEWDRYKMQPMGYLLDLGYCVRESETKFVIIYVVVVNSIWQQIHGLTRAYWAYLFSYYTNDVNQLWWIMHSKKHGSVNMHGAISIWEWNVP